MNINTNEIAKMIKSNTFKENNIPMIDTYFIKELSDYFEREDLKQAKEKLNNSNDLTPEDLEPFLSFNPKEFLKLAGVE